MNQSCELMSAAQPPGRRREAMGLQGREIYGAEAAGRKGRRSRERGPNSAAPCEGRDTPRSWRLRRRHRSRARTAPPDRARESRVSHATPARDHRRSGRENRDPDPRPERSLHPWSAKRETRGSDDREHNQHDGHRRAQDHPPANGRGEPLLPIRTAQDARSGLVLFRPVISRPRNQKGGPSFLRGRLRSLTDDRSVAGQAGRDGHRDHRALLHGDGPGDLAGDEPVDGHGHLLGDADRHLPRAAVSATIRQVVTGRSRSAPRRP